MADTIKVFIGYDENETVAFHVLAHSIMRHASKPVEIVPVVKSHMSAFYTRERSGLESTDFSFTRFLAPYLCDYNGMSIDDEVDDGQLQFDFATDSGEDEADAATLMDEVEQFLREQGDGK